MDKLTASEAVFGFCAWLTTRDEKTVMSAMDDAAPIVELIKKFCDTNGLEGPRGDWHKELIHPKEEKSMKRVFEIEFKDDLGPMWMNQDNLLTCLLTKTNCAVGTILNVRDITEEQWLLNTIKKKILKKVQ